MRSFIFLFLLLLKVNSQAQTIQDEFSDGDLSTDLSWQGDLNHFMINTSEQLQLSNSVAGMSSIATELPVLTGDSEWNFFLRMAFSPSSSNYAKFWLCSDSSVLESSTNGVFIKFGEAGSSDAIELYRKQGGVSTLLARGVNGQIATSFSLFLKVTHHANGEWKLFTSSSATGFFSLIASTADLNALTGRYTGLSCYYTSSNASKFYMDDFKIGEAAIDSFPPSIESIAALSPVEVQVLFNESLEESSFNKNNFNLSPAIIVDTVFPASADHRTAVVRLTDDLQNGVTYTFSATGICDASMNCGIDEISLNHYLPEKYEIVFNELMIDPTPSQGLPESEFIELFNRTDRTLDLSSWYITINNGPPKLLLDAYIEPNGFLILTNESSVDEFALRGNVKAVGGLSSTALLNEGAEIKLFNNRGELIHEIRYSSDWYNEQVKSTGGWSLEQINPNAVCSDRRNWKATLNTEGGTPGIPNSVLFSGPPFQLPAVEAICLLEDNSIQVDLSPSTDLSGLLDPHLFDLGTQSPDSVSNHLGMLTLNFDTELAPNTILAFQILTPLKNCIGIEQSVEPVNLSSNKGQQNDVVITEIMADPEPSRGLPLQEYMELYNRSRFPISLKGWRLSCGNTSIELPCFTLQPMSYLVLSEKFQPALGEQLEIPSFPSLSNEGTTLILKNKEGKIIHSVEYTSDWQSLPKKEGGWALEMKDANNPCAGKLNWGSSTDTKGGTPGTTNSIESVNPDQIPPQAKYAVVVDEKHIRLFFTEALNVERLPSISIDHGIGSPKTINADNNLRSLLLELNRPVQDSIKYAIAVDGYVDCLMNGGSAQTVFTGFSEEAHKNDMVINEILSEARHPDEEFVELYNRSGKTISLADLLLGEPDTVSGDLSGFKQIDTTGYLLFPGDYIAVCLDDPMMCRYYNCKAPLNLLTAKEISSFKNEGIIALVNMNGEVIDQLSYDNQMHSPVLSQTKGVSLERIDPSGSSGDRSNWHSASEHSGGATPGYLNSHYRREDQPENFTVEPEVFSPDNDGIDDLLNISFESAVQGTVANVFIFSGTGSLQRKLIEGQISGSSARYSWDGTSDDGELCRRGIYVIYFETFAPDGTVKNQKRHCVLSGAQ